MKIPAMIGPSSPRTRRGPNGASSSGGPLPLRGLPPRSAAESTLLGLGDPLAVRRTNRKQQMASLDSRHISAGALHLLEEGKRHPTNLLVIDGGHLKFRWWRASPQTARPRQRSCGPSKLDPTTETAQS